MGAGGKQRIVIVGSGIAGLTVALSTAGRDVLMVTRGQRGRSGSTPLAQGGIAAPWHECDSSMLHARDTVIAGSGVNNASAVDVLTHGARSAIEWLIYHGVQFDAGVGGLALCLEGGHSLPRILHAGGDASGMAVAEALTSCASHSAHIQWREHTEVTGLVMVGGCVRGVSLTGTDGRTEVVESGAVVLATGGIGALYRWSSNPAESDGAGLALGILAGAEVADLEFVQFHPTLLRPQKETVGTRLHLVSEAVRGAGGRLIDSSNAFIMDGVHPSRDLAPRDVVARRVWEVIMAGNNVFLDARCVGEEWPKRFPGIFAACMQHGVDPRTTPIPVVPAPHFHMGGLRTDLQGATSVPGLYAVGEVACTGVHGANRLASNSLLEGVVFGRRLGARLDSPEVLSREACVTGAAYAVSSKSLADSLADEFRERVTEALGPSRHKDGMISLRNWINEAPGLSGTRQAIVVTAILDAALGRPVSLGAHFRTDTPSPEHRASPAAEPQGSLQASEPA
ncbi:FAD-binding protein [Luteibacter sp. PPL554]